jgi:hypothetical protein
MLMRPHLTRISGGALLISQRVRPGFTANCTADGRGASMMRARFIAETDFDASGFR